MQAVAEKQPEQIEWNHLSADLKYHINLLNLLAGCKLGPKLQAVYPLEHVTAAIVDPVTIYPVKKALANLLLEMLKERVGGLDASEAMWKVMDTIAEFIESVNVDMKTLIKFAGIKSVQVLQVSEWFGLSLQIVQGFLKDFSFVHFNAVVLSPPLPPPSLSVIPPLHNDTILSPYCDISVLPISH